MLPASAQGAIGIDHLSARGELAAFLSVINDRATFTAVMAERAFLEALGGNCHSPVAAHAVVDGGEITLHGEILSEDGAERYAGSSIFALSDTAGPARLAAELIGKASGNLRALFAA
jgi:hydroxymethylbilane synthase